MDSFPRVFVKIVSQCNVLDCLDPSMLLSHTVITFLSQRVRFFDATAYSYIMTLNLN
jgi:hypothetical protein